MKTNKINVVLSLNKSVVSNYIVYVDESDKIVGQFRPTGVGNTDNRTGYSYRCDDLHPTTATGGKTLGTTGWSTNSGCC